ncbi:hypothetical protein ColLi_09140 [Colletotrichum liriopes]|uniref:Uncharacterized protein n=1 Tax=Colletotrichum liriopes TaxID=708192 RepID=A0AA37GSS4_9PEZI|nr:hypothetical protein ColLi_09140 [Colletotrichum liriopes]
MAQDQDPVVTPSSGYECFVYVYNKTKVDLLLVSSNAVHGYWPPGSPPNTIEAGTEGLVQLNDSFGFTGSQGEVVYEIYPPSQPDKPISFTIEFSDPFGKWNDNYLKARASNPKLLSTHILPYTATGHPFTGEDNDAELVRSSSAEPFPQLSNTATMIENEKGVHLKYEIGFKGPLGIPTKQSIHEDMAIAAFIGSKLPFPKGTEYNNLNANQWEYMRGLVWSDDPTCLLFIDSKESNNQLGVGAEFLQEFWYGSEYGLTKRSHFGDLQLLHGMGSQANEDPNITKKNMIDWLEIIYKLAIGQDVAAADRLDKRFPDRFTANSNPSGDVSLKQLFLGTTPSYRKANIPRRALGNCLHMIQDSYAVGHTLRRLTNPEDLDRNDEEGYRRFKAGKYAKLGPIITFHTYSGQSNRHSYYDGSKLNRVPKNLDTFNNIIGARDGIDKSKKLINFFAEKTKWEDGVRDFFDNEVFALDPQVTFSNPQVDDRFGLPDTSGQSGLEAELQADEEYRLGMSRKLALADGTLSFPNDLYARKRRNAAAEMLHKLRTPVLVSLKFVISILGLVLGFLLSQLLLNVFKMK